MKKLLFILTLSLLFASCLKQTTTHFSQDTTTQDDSDADSVRITNFINNLKLDFVSGEIDTSCIIDWDSVDAILSLQRTGCCDGNVIYSPDSLFKVYVISGEDCGINCNPFWKSYVYSKTGNKLLTKEKIPLNYITDIYKLPDNKYLIIQKEWFYASAGVPKECRAALLISIKNDSLLFTPLIEDVDDNNFSKDFYLDDNGFTFCQYNVFPTDPELTFDSLNSTLHYQFRKHDTLDSGIDSDSLITGTLKYDNGIFKKLNHEIKFIEPIEW